MKTKRNDKCPCKSGKMYKHCCIHVNAQNMPATVGRDWDIIESDLDNLSNSVLDLIQEKKYDEAKAACHKLLTEYPDQIDGLSRFAMLFEAEGKFAEALEYTEKTIIFVQTHLDEFGSEYLSELQDDQKRLKAKLELVPQVID